MDTSPPTNNFVFNETSPNEYKLFNILRMGTVDVPVKIGDSLSAFNPRD